MNLNLCDQEKGSLMNAKLEEKTTFFEFVYFYAPCFNDYTYEKIQKDGE